MTRLDPPLPGEELSWVERHLGHLVDPEDRSPDGRLRASGRFRGTQAAATAALRAVELRGYAASRNEVWPREHRGATALSPYLRHGLLDLPAVWDSAARAPAKDREKFRDELAWQEYARHMYARLGGITASPLRFDPPPTRLPAEGASEPWDRSMRCVDEVVGELETDGWIVNQTRMWLASHWTVRAGADWTDGENRFFRHLLDGSRAANRLGWQWTIGTGTGQPYGFSRWQVTKRAPGLCDSCPRREDCPIEEWADRREPGEHRPDPLLDHDPDVAATAGPDGRPRPGASGGRPAAVWLTAESIGDADPALAAHPDLPVVFVFDEPLLTGLRLSSKRLVFLSERLAELGVRRDLEVHLGRPLDVLAERSLAVTFAPVPGFRKLASALPELEVHPWPWLRRPRGGSLRSFSAWGRAWLRSSRG